MGPELGGDASAFQLEVVVSKSKREEALLSRKTGGREGQLSEELDANLLFPVATEARFEKFRALQGGQQGEEGHEEKKEGRRGEGPSS